MLRLRQVAALCLLCNTRLTVCTPCCSSSVVPDSRLPIDGCVQVQVDKERRLIVSGDRKQEGMDGNWKQQKQERRFGAFQRKFQLPEDADVNKIQGKAENGVLTITIRKVPKEDVQSDNTSVPIY